jgi:hypothetical protein
MCRHHLFDCAGITLQNLPTARCLSQGFHGIELLRVRAIISMAVVAIADRGYAFLAVRGERRVCVFGAQRWFESCSPSVCPHYCGICSTAGAGGEDTTTAPNCSEPRHLFRNDPPTSVRKDPFSRANSICREFTDSEDTFLRSRRSITGTIDKE